MGIKAAEAWQYLVRKLLLGVAASHLSRKKDVFSFDTTSLCLLSILSSHEFVFASHCHGVKRSKPHHCLGLGTHQPSPKV